MRARIVLLCCLAALVVVTVVPRGAWVLRSQWDTLIGRQLANIVPQDVPLVPGAPGYRVAEMRHLSSHDPDYDAMRKVAEAGPRDDSLLWLMAARQASGALGRLNFDTKALALAKEAAKHLNKEEDRTFRTFLEALIAHREGRDADAWRALKDLSVELPQDRPNLALTYDNGSQREVEQVIAYNEAVLGYRGEYGRLMASESVWFNEMGSFRTLIAELTRSAGDQDRLAVALIGAHLARTSSEWIETVIGRSMLEVALKPRGVEQPTELKKQLEALRRWAADMDKRTGSTLATSLESETRFTRQPIPEGYEWGLERLEAPFKAGGLVLACCFGLAWSLGWALFWSRLSDREGYRASAPHLAAAAGWIIAAIFMQVELAWMLGLISLSHISFAAAMGSDRFAKVTTGFLAAAVLALFATVPSTWPTALPGISLFVGAAVLPWVVDRPGRHRWGILAGWAISIGCIVMAWFAPESLLPVAAWIVGLAVVRPNPKPRPVLGFIGSLLGFLLMAVCAAAIAALYSRSGGQLVTGVLYFCVVLMALALLPAKLGKSIVSSAGAVAAVLVTLTYVGAVGWSLRSDRVAAEMRKELVSLAEKMRERGQGRKA